MTIVVGLSGKARSGKNSVYFLSKILFDEDDTGKVRKVAFADALKRMARDGGWNGIKDEEGRILLQDLGMEKRKDDENYWVRQAETMILGISAKYEPLIIFVTDCRFPNELAMLKRIGAKVWRVRRPVIEPSQTDLHPSETALDSYKDWDSIIVANDMTELFEQVKANLRRLGLL